MDCVKCNAVSVFLCLFLACISVMSSCDESVFLPLTTAPAGFEDLAQPRETLVDIYFGGRYLTSQLVLAGAGFIELNDPVEVTRLIGFLTDPELVISALSGRLDLLSNDHTNTSATLSDQVSVAGVTYDESTFRVDIFVNRRFLLSRSSGVRKYLPPSDAGFSVMQNLSATVSGFRDSGSHDSRSSIYGITMAAWQENSLFWNWDYASGQALSTRSLFAQRHRQGVEYDAGLIAPYSYGFNFLVDQSVAGVRVNTSYKTRLDRDYSHGTSIDVFLPTRAWVEVRENDRLIYSAFFEAGAQQLDTSSFPNGAYDIDIRILDDSGQTLSTETRFFAKQSMLPAPDEWLYFVEAGKVINHDGRRSFPEVTGLWQSRGAISRRLGETLAASAQITLHSHGQIGELGAYFFGHNFDASPSLMTASDGSKGVAFNGTVNSPWITLSGAHRRIWSKPQNRENQGLSDFFGTVFKQQSLSAAIPAPGGSLGYRYSLSQRYQDEHQSKGTSRGHYLDYRYQLFRTLDYDGDISATVGKVDGSRSAVLHINFRYRSGNTTIQASPHAEYVRNGGESEHSERLRVSTNWYNRDLPGDMTADTGIEGGSGETRLDGSLQYANRLGRINGSAIHTRYGGRHSTSWGGNLSSRILFDETTLAVGGETLSESALVMNLQGASDQVFDVNVDGYRHGYAVVGSPTVISMAPFGQYRVGIKPAGTGLYYFDESEQIVTLYPGNVVTLNYPVFPLSLVYGRLFLDGEPLSGGLVASGDDVGSVDDLGLFQLELSGQDDNLRVQLTDGRTCLVPLLTLEKGYLQPQGNVSLSSRHCW
ncbi:TcfC E-set like domain-containing protein [Endozoicomonas ascidiicola]|uniref:TcfC E-set like domain-containing protein n=1 Tax=Endozoicomonas ascidiicola TaxID=1698521 RepID=UPI00082D34EB|nr:TcfC E-set like domain-containing protein [Endozoicomonas ascidiicola]